MTAPARKKEPPGPLDEGQIARLVESILEDGKAESISCIDVRQLTSITDYMVMATGNSRIHTRALADAIVERMKGQGVATNGIEGLPAAEWLLVDLGPVVVHIMLAQVRALYDLEELWNLKPANEE